MTGWQLQHCKNKKSGITSSSRNVNFEMTSIRGNTIHSVWPKPPPARREGSSGLFAMRSIKKPAKAKKGGMNDSPLRELFIPL